MIGTNRRKYVSLLCLNIISWNCLSTPFNRFMLILCFSFCSSFLSSSVFAFFLSASPARFLDGFRCCLSFSLLYFVIFGPRFSVARAIKLNRTTSDRRRAAKQKHIETNRDAFHEKSTCSWLPRKSEHFWIAANGQNAVQQIRAKCHWLRLFGLRRRECAHRTHMRFACTNANANNSESHFLALNQHLWAETNV